MIETTTLTQHSVLLVTLNGDRCPPIYRAERSDDISKLLTKKFNCEVVIIYDDIVKNIEIIEPNVL